MNEYGRKFDAAVAELSITMMRPANQLPPALKLQRAMGLKVRPPHYVPFWRIFLGYAVFFGIVWGLITWFWRLRDAGFSVFDAMGSAAIAGTLFGLIMALYYARGRRKYRLSKWEDL